MKDKTKNNGISNEENYINWLLTDIEQWFIISCSMHRFQNCLFKCHCSCKY